jgi:hypothetical protein
VPAALISKESEKKKYVRVEKVMQTTTARSAVKVNIGLDVFFTVCARMGKVNAWLF